MIFIPTHCPFCEKELNKNFKAKNMIGCCLANDHVVQVKDYRTTQGYVQINYVHSGIVASEIKENHFSIVFKQPNSLYKHLFFPPIQSQKEFQSTLINYLEAIWLL